MDGGAAGPRVRARRTAAAAASELTSESLVAYVLAQPISDTTTGPTSLGSGGTPAIAPIITPWATTSSSSGRGGTKTRTSSGGGDPSPPPPPPRTPPPPSPTPPPP